MHLNPLESARLGIVLAVMAETLILLGWVFMRHRLRWWHWLIGPALLALALGLDLAVETDPEQLRRITKEIVKAAENEDAQAIVARLHEDLHLDNGMRKSSVVRVIQQYCSQPQIAKNVITVLDVVRAEPAAGTVNFTAVTTIDPRSPYAVVSAIKSRWRFEYVRPPGREYEITNMVVIDLGGEGPFDIFRMQPRHPLRQIP